VATVVSLSDYRPSPRYDSLPWTQARIEEAPAATGPWSLLETQDLTPVDADPANPAYRDFTTQLGTGDELWYRIVFLDADGDVGLPTAPVQNLADDRPVYATVEELAQLLRVSATQRHASLMRVLKAAADEIDSEVGATDIAGRTTPYSNPPAVAREVNMERAVEHWQQMQSPFGVLGLGSEVGGTYTANDSWNRHAHKLAVLRGSFGIA
jgi:hypothetical protein